jgi:DNA-binding NtrC family response regulator
MRSNLSQGLASLPPVWRSNERKEDAMKHHSILVVDDEKNVLSAIQRALRKEPYAVYSADSAEKALQLIKAREVNIVISDYNMPQTNGLEFLKQVKSLYPYILTIMLTGQAEVQLAVEAINTAGVYKFILKPWDDEDLKITVRRSLESIDLVSERDRLLEKVKSRDAILNDLESKFPGISKVRRDDEGYLILQ